MPSLFFYYTFWHYGEAPRDIIQIWKNVLWFFYNFFSIPLLLTSLFAPFERLDEHTGKRFDVQAIFESLIVNILMRLVGFGLRFFTIILGTFLLLTTLIGGLVVLVIWLLAPLVLTLLMLTGLFLIAI